MAKRFVFLQLLFAVVFLCVNLGVAQADDQPPALLPEAGTANGAVTEERGKYAAEEFDALSDADKQQVYLHQPQRLPDNYSPERYPMFLQAE